MFYQALVGAWPAERLTDPVPGRGAPHVRRANERLHAQGDQGSEASHVAGCTRTRSTKTASGVSSRPCSAGDRAELFLRLVRSVPAAPRLVRHARLAGAAGAALGAPGVPGHLSGLRALESVSLVDPDNRRPVDFDLRRKRSLRCSRPSRRGGRASTARPDNGPGHRARSKLFEHVA